MSVPPGTAQIHVFLVPVGHRVGSCWILGAACHGRNLAGLQAGCVAGQSFFCRSLHLAMGHKLCLHFGADGHPCTILILTRGTTGFDHHSHSASAEVPPRPKRPKRPKRHGGGLRGPEATRRGAGSRAGCAVHSDAGGGSAARAVCSAWDGKRRV